MIIDCSEKGKRLAGMYMFSGDRYKGELIGLVIQDNPYRRGACVKLKNGNLVQVNAGVVRTLPKDLSYIV